MSADEAELRAMDCPHCLKPLDGTAVEFAGSMFHSGCSLSPSHSAATCYCSLRQRRRIEEIAAQASGGTEGG